MVQFRKLMGRVAWAIGGLGEELSTTSPVVRCYTLMTQDPRAAEARYARNYREREAVWSVMEPVSAREVEAAGQLTLFPLPVVPHLATQRGFSLAGMEINFLATGGVV